MFKNKTLYDFTSYLADNPVLQALSAGEASQLFADLKFTLQRIKQQRRINVFATRTFILEYTRVYSICVA